MSEIISRLEQQRDAVDSALSALREVLGPGMGNGTAEAAAPKARKKRKGGMTPEGKARLIAALKRRWAAKKAAADGPVAAKKRGRPRVNV